MDIQKTRADFGAYIKNRREIKGLTQTQLGEMIGTNKTTIAHYETGRRAASLTTIIQLEEILNFQFDDFVKSIKR
ncbi:MAG: helix-turn-helix domain-containing protein [Porphyromonadaceae bacterium]|nr:helix-turn-helix domain-containing protein [Porphyromonadaceae bacterium]